MRPGHKRITLLPQVYTSMDTCVAHTLDPVWLHLLMFHLLFLCPGEVKSTVILDREVTPDYRLVVQATDGGGHWCRAEVKLIVTDVNDNPPIFTLSQYTASVYEDTVPKALLTRIQAIDPDEGNTTTTSITAITSGIITTANSSEKPILYFIYKRPFIHKIQGASI